MGNNGTDILNKKKFENYDDGTYVKGYVYIQDFEYKSQKNGGQYISGTLQANGVCNFIVWNSQYGAYAVMSTNKENYKNKVAVIEGKVNKFGGSVSLIIETINTDIGEVSLSECDFFESKYDENKWFSVLNKTVKDHCSSDAYDIFCHIINPIKDLFLKEFAAIYYHDNCKSGLLAHTTKVVKIANIVSLYPNLLKRVNKDELYIGCALHDIGKVYEYSNGSISDMGKLISHRTIGVLLIYNNKDYIISKMGDKFYYDLLSVIEQHHGEYGERPRTIISYVIHLIDSLDSELTSLNELIANSNTEQIIYNGTKLN